MNKSREDFEAWLKNVYISQGLNHQYLWGYDEQEERYSHRASHVRWEAWQASRAAIELDIDWPEANDDFYKEGEEGVYAMGHEDGKDKVVIAVRQALKSAGITLKGEKPCQLK